MKKILIIVLIILLLILSGLIIFKGIKIGNFEIKSIYGVKQINKDLDDSLQTCKELTNKTYPEAIETLQTAIRNLKEKKEQYNSKTATELSDVSDIGITQIKTYDIEFLWTRIGNYASDRGVVLTLNITNGKALNAYNLEFIVAGTYNGITDFLYDLEEDDELDFKIENFSIEPITKEIVTNNTKNNNTVVNKTTNTIGNVTNNAVTNSTVIVDTINLKSTFSVLDIGINLE